MREFLIDIWTAVSALGKVALCAIPWVILGVFLPKFYWNWLTFSVLAILLLSLSGGYIRRG